MKKWWNIFLFLKLLLASNTTLGLECLYKPRISNSSVLIRQPPNPKFSLRNGKNTIQDCSSCITIWLQLQDGTSKVLEQGCYLNQDDHCQSQQCIQDQKLDERLSLKTPLAACCCSGPLCNENAFRPALSTDFISSNVNFWIILVILVLISMSLSLLLCLLKSKILSKKHGREPKHHGDVTSLCPENPIEVEKALISQTNKRHVDFNGCEILGAIHVGKFGTTIFKVSDGLIWKQYKGSNKQRFFNERDVYEILKQSSSTDVKEEPSLFLNYFGSHESSTDDTNNSHQWIICLELASKGSLASYLKPNTLSWAQTCAMLIDISKGLSQLHNVYGLVHRQLNSTNILIRGGLEGGRDDGLLHCCIGDFGQACSFDSSNIIGNYYYDYSNRDDPLENDDDDGMITPDSIRYQAPEVLDGLFNLSWTQVDVYSLGLLFWELSLRCHELYQGVKVPPFQLAYQKEIGLKPSHEQMKILVMKNKARPLFPEVWKNSNPAIQQLKETIMDSWDHDGEARLTSSCVVERVRELGNLWEHYKLVSAGPPILDLVQPNNTQPRQEAKITTYFTNILNEEASSMSKHRNCAKLKNDNVDSGQQPLIKIQPHQGLNPCLERNFASNNISKVDDSSTQFIHGSKKDKPKPRPTPSVQAESTILNDSMTIPRHHFVHPIPYLQNDIQSSSSKRMTKNLNLKANSSSCNTPSFKKGGF